MKTEDIKWNVKTILYVLAINEFVKFGITNNWKRREKKYNEEFLNQTFYLIKKYDFDFRWQAELIEQVVKWRLWDYIVFRRHEYTILPLTTVIDIIENTIEEIKTDFFKLEYIHKNAEKRWSFYRQLAGTYFKKISFPEFDAKVVCSRTVRLYLKGIKDIKLNNYGHISYILVVDNEIIKEFAKTVLIENKNQLELISLQEALNSIEIKQFKDIEIISNSNDILYKIRMIEFRRESKIAVEQIENEELWKAIEIKLSAFDNVNALNLRDENMIICLQKAKDLLYMN